MAAAHQYKCSDEVFIETWRRLQSPTLIAKELGYSAVRAMQGRRRQIEKQYGIVLPVTDKRPKYNTAEIDSERAVFATTVSDGQVIVGSDIHIRPGYRTTMQRAFIHFAKSRKLLPNLVGCILNGDVLDFPKISRHPSIGWERHPTPASEIEAAGDWAGELVKARQWKFRAWAAGNHDLRWESRIAALLPELAGVKGAHLKDWFPEWTPCWRVDINSDVVIKHRGQGGEHADWNNVMKAGKTIITGHDHRANVTAYRDYRGVRWGVRCGYMGESPLDPQFVHYMEASETSAWIPAFVVLTFVGGELLWPELVTKHADGVVNWRGELISC